MAAEWSLNVEPHLTPPVTIRKPELQKHSSVNEVSCPKTFNERQSKLKFGSKLQS
jgi:hypothetical protein